MTAGPGESGAAPGRRRGWAAAALGVVVAVGLFFSPALLGPGQFLYRDAGRGYYPEKRLVAAALRAGELPEWNPHAGLGVPLVAGSVASLQHPLNVLFVALPFEGAFSLWVVLNVALGGLGALAWARTLGAGPAPAAVAGVAFALSGFLVSSTDNLIHLATMAGAPWLLAAARRHAAAGAPPALAAALGASFLCASGGEVLDWAVAAALAAGQAWLPGGPALPAGRRAARSLQVTLAAFAGAAPTVLPFLAFLPGSSRGSGVAPAEAAHWSLHPIRLAELAVPHLVRGPYGTIRNELYLGLTGDPVGTPWTLSLYVGASVVLLAAVAAARSALGRVLLALAGLGLWASMGPRAGFAWVASQLPVLGATRYYERLAGWPTLLLGVAAALGASALLADRATARRTAIGAGLGAVVLLGISLAGGLGPALAAAAGAPAIGAELAGNLAEGARAAAAALAGVGLLALACARGLRASLLPGALAAVVALDLASANVRAYVLSDPAVVFEADAPIPEWLARHPEAGRVTAPFKLDATRWPELLPYESSWRWGARTAAPAFHLAWGAGNVDAYGGVRPGRLHRFVREVPLQRRARHAGLVGVGAVVVPYQLEQGRAAGLTPPWRVLAHDPALPAWLLAIPHRPRVYVAAELLATDEAGALAFLASADAATEARTAVEGSVPAGYHPPRGSSRLVADARERVVVEVETDGPALLVLGDQWLDGWRAALDGREVPVLPVNYLVRGVWVGPGRHEVVFSYRTPLWREGWLVLVAGLGAIAVAAALRRRAGARV